MLARRPSPGNRYSCCRPRPGTVARAAGAVRSGESDVPAGPAGLAHRPASVPEDAHHPGGARGPGRDLVPELDRLGLDLRPLVVRDGGPASIREN